MTEFVVGCPAWDRAWSLDLWFESVRANVPPGQTGLVFVVPPSDQATRDKITVLGNRYGFAWVEVLRDKYIQFDRDKRGTEDHHRTLAMARNHILTVVHDAAPEWFISWDSDLLVAPGTVESTLAEHPDLPIRTVWTWLNRQEPETMRHVTPDEIRLVRWQEPAQATAMRWEGYQKAAHLPGHEFKMRRDKNLWRTDVVLGFQLMNRQCYDITRYEAHPDGEDIPFNWTLQRRGVPRYCVGHPPGVHLYQHDPEEIKRGWPDIMDLGREIPLAAQEVQPRDQLDETLGFYPMESSLESAVAAGYSASHVN